MVGELLEGRPNVHIFDICRTLRKQGHMSTATRPAQDNFCLGTALLGEKPVPHLRSEDAVLKVLIYKVNRIPSCSTTFVDAQQNHQLSSCHSKLPHQDSLQPRFHLITSKHFYSTLAVQWKSHRVLICALAWEFSGKSSHSFA